MGIPQRVEIPLFPGAKRIAVTTSWDDGTINDRRLVELMNELGLKGTFNLNSGFFSKPHAHNTQHIDASEVAGLYAGHEVAIHTRTHPFLDRLDASQVACEVLDDRQALEDLVGYPVRGMAYPFGTTSARVIQVLRALGIVYARTTESKENPWPWPEPLAWPATAHMFAQGPTVPERFERFYEAWNRRGSGLFYVWGHSYEFNSDDPARNWSAFPRIFEPLARRPDVWYCTNIELFDYEAARQQVVIAANRRSAFNPSGMAVTVVVDGGVRALPPGQVVGL